MLPFGQASAINPTMRFRFGEFTLDSATGSVEGPDGALTLRRQTFRLLEVLLEHAPDLLDRDTLLDEAWGRTALSPNVLPQAVSELRQALGDSAREPRYIETLHRRGYRMACPVERLDGPAKTGPGAISRTGQQALMEAPAPESSGNRRNAFLAVLAIVGMAVLLLLWWQHAGQRARLYTHHIPEIRQLLAADVATAWARTREIRKDFGNDPTLEQLWHDISLPVTLSSEPEGADVHVRTYAGDDAEWIHLGTTPLIDAGLPLAHLRYRVELEGYRSIEAAPSVLPRAEPFHLFPEQQAPEDMVYVPAGPVTYRGESEQLPGFWIDRHEVTNREFRAFVEAGGYRDPGLWPESIEVDGETLSFERYIDHFVDTTGMPGPSTWAMGTWPSGRDSHPVEGVSWYEAMAFARWTGKQLPTLFHWRRAAGLGTAQAPNFSDIVLASNFNGSGTLAVGASDGLGAYGTYDMAGNVAEWTRNPAGELRHILGGSWVEDTYRFSDPEARDPLARGPGTGLRLMHPDEPVAPALTRALESGPLEVPEPVDDATFEIYARQFDYDPKPLEARVEEGDNSHRDWYRERVTFSAAYPGQRVSAWIYTPRGVERPAPTVVNFPGGDALMLDDSRKAGLNHVEPFLRSGHIVVYPVYLGTFERRIDPPSGPNSWRALLVDQVRDLRRTLDYLETRNDVDPDRIILHAVSYGGYRAPYALAVEKRFASAIVLSTGLVRTDRIPLEVQLQDYLPRVELPFLLINGRSDFNFPHAESQQPYFELLGTPPEHKRHVVLDFGHLPPNYAEVIRAYLQWSERWHRGADPAG